MDSPLYPTDDEIVGMINIVTDLYDVDAMDKAYPEVLERMTEYAERLKPIVLREMSAALAEEFTSVMNSHGAMLGKPEMTTTEHELIKNLMGHAVDNLTTEKDVFWLRPCPLCGCFAVSMSESFAYAEPGDPDEGTTANVEAGLVSAGHFVECESCGCAGPNEETPEIATKKWNKRTTSDTRAVITNVDYFEQDAMIEIDGRKAYFQFPLGKNPTVDDALSFLLGEMCENDEGNKS